MYMYICVYSYVYMYIYIYEPCSCWSDRQTGRRARERASEQGVGDSDSDYSGDERRSVRPHAVYKGRDRDMNI